MKNTQSHKNVKLEYFNKIPLWLFFLDIPTKYGKWYFSFLPMKSAAV